MDDHFVNSMYDHFLAQTVTKRGYSSKVDRSDLYRQPPNANWCDLCHSAEVHGREKLTIAASQAVHYASEPEQCSCDAGDRGPVGRDSGARLPAADKVDDRGGT